jgi:hypothetical protein
VELNVPMITAVKSKHNKEKTLQQLGARLEKQMFGPFMYVF